MRSLATAAAAADEIKYVLLIIFGLVVAALEIWRRMSKTRTDAAVDSADRRRVTDAIEDAAKARKEAHEVKNEMMSVQRRMGRLESENESCLESNKELRAANAELRERIKNLENHVDLLARSLKKTYNPTSSDL